MNTISFTPVSASSVPQSPVRKWRRTVWRGVWMLLSGLWPAGTPVQAEERLLLAADNQVVEINRAGRVTDLIAGKGHGGIYDVWRLPDGGIAYAHSKGLAVFDAHKNLVVAHPARAGSKGTEANGCAVLDGGARFAMVDAGVNQIRVVDRSGAVVRETPLPVLEELPTHARYRTIRAVLGERAYWVAQYSRKTLLKVEEGTGKVLESRDLGELLKPEVSGPVFSSVVIPGGSMWVATSTGRQLVKLGDGVERVLTAGELGLKCRYLLGTQKLENGNLVVACGDYHLKAAEEGEDVLAEVDPAGKVVWRLTRAQLVDQVAGYVDPRSGLEEMRVTHVHVYDHERLEGVLNAVR